MKKLLSIILIISMVLTSVLWLASCDTDVKETEAPTEAVTEAPTAEETTGEATPPATDGESDTVATEPETETDFGEYEDKSETESEAPVATEPVTDPVVTDPTTEPATETPTEPATEPATEPEVETEPIPVGPAEPLCETCEFKTVKGYPICKVCGYVAPCYGVHEYTANVEGHWKPACEHCGKGEGKAQNHEYEERVEDEGDLLLYSFKCPICLFVAYEQEVPYHINAFYSAGEVSKTDFTGSGFSQGFGFEAGVGYSAFTTEAGGTFTVAIASGAEPNAPTGQFLVMKVRMPKSQSSFSASIKSNSALSSHGMVFNGLSAGWVTIIVDITKAVVVTEKVNEETEETYKEYQGYAPDAAGDYYLTDFSITGKASGGESFDIAYVLFCDKLEDAESFVSEQGGVTTVYRYLESLDKSETEKKECLDENGNPIIHKYVVNEDGTHTLTESCYQCGLKAVEGEPHTYMQITLDDGDFTYRCSACGHSRFGEGININKFIDAVGVDTTAMNYYRNTKNGIFTDAEGGFDYASYSGQGGTAQIIFTRNTADANASEKAAYFSVGTAKYFVIRMKTNRPSMNYTWTFATYDAEKVVGKHNGEIKGEFPKTTSFSVPISFGGEDKWTTYVMDLTKLAPNSWVADADGNHMVYTMYCNIGGTDYNADVNINFEYMAFVDDWDEIRAIVSDETVVNVLSGGGANLVETATNSCVGDHSGVTSETENGYKVECAVCGKLITEIVIPEGINYYSNLGDMDKYMQGSLEKFLYDEENDVLYNRYEGTASSHLNLTGGAGAGTWTTDKYLTGEYIVIKYRMQSVGLSFNIATKDFGQNPSYNDTTRPYYSSLGTRKCTAGLSYWSVALIKIPNMAGEDAFRYTKGEELEIGIMISTTSSPYIFDIAYVAIVDSPEEAELLLEEGETLVDLGESWSGEITEVMPEKPESDEPEEGKVYEVTEFGPDKLVAPPENPTGTFDITKMEEDGVSFVRINNMNVNKDGWAAINYLNNSHSAKGRYFAMKFRIGDNGLNQTFLKIYTGTTGVLQGEGQGVAIKVVEGGEWCVIVVDLTKLIGDKGTYMMKGADGSYALRYFAIRPFSNAQKSAVGTDAYMDIAYIKFFEHKSQIKDVVDSEFYDWAIDKSTNTTLRTEDNSCVTCSVSEMKDGNVYKYVCSSCGKEHKSITVPESVTKYYSANEIATEAKNYYGPNGSYGFASEDGVAYTETKGMLQIIWQRAMADMDGQNKSGPAQHFTESVGNAKYVVVKVRGNGETSRLTLNLSTTARNATLAVAEENKPGYCKGYTGDKDTWIDEASGEEVQGVLAGGEYRSAVGYKGAFIIPEGAGNGEWMTCVIDLAALYGEYYAKAEGEDFYNVDSLFFNIGGDVDFAYVAFVEGDWADIDALVDESTVANITNVDGAFEMVNVADGTPAAKAE